PLSGLADVPEPSASGALPASSGAGGGPAGSPPQAASQRVDAGISNANRSRRAMVILQGFHDAASRLCNATTACRQGRADLLARTARSRAQPELLRPYCNVPAGDIRLELFNPSCAILRLSTGLLLWLNNGASH